MGAAGRPVSVAASKGAVSDNGTVVFPQSSPGGDPPHLCDKIKELLKKGVVSLNEKEKMLFGKKNQGAGK